jgi:peptide/nickel transport system substrate-binding protein
MYQMFDIVPTGFQYVSFNVTDPVFQDVNVRKAFNLAVDKETMLQVVLQGKGLVADGTMSPAMLGYDPAAMDGSGYPFDLEEAKSLMQEAGYTYDADGMLLTPDGEPFKIILHGTTDETTVKAMQVLVDMWGKLGVEVELQQLEWGTLAPLVFQGQYQATMMGIGWPDADVLYLMYSTASLGGTNFAFVEDATMDDLLSRARSETDPVKQQQVVDDAFKYIQDQAYAVPLVIPTSFVAIHNDFQGIIVSPYIGIVISEAYYAGQ